MIISVSEVSIVYKGINILTEDQIIIKEFYPKSIAIRDLDNKTIINRLPSSKKKFDALKQNFLHEAIILQQLSHDNIIKYISHFEENNTAYIVTEYYDGITLNQYLKSIPLHKRHSLFNSIFIPLINALHYIHKKGIIHRDIKPSNIMINSKKNVFLLDFGSAIFYKNNEEASIFTTPGYSALEQYSKKAKQGIKTDIYGFAATLYYSLTDVVPIDISQRLITGKVSSVKSNNRKITLLLSMIISWSLALAQKKRCFSLNFIKLALLIDKYFK